MTASHGTSDPTAPSGLRQRGATVFWAGALVAVVHLVFVGVRPEATTLDLAVLVGAVCVGLLGYQGFASRRMRRYVGPLAEMGIFFAVFVGVASLLSWQLSLWQASVAFLAFVALLSYGLHRYQLFTLGLTEESDER